MRVRSVLSTIAKLLSRDLARAAEIAAPARLEIVKSPTGRVEIEQSVHAVVILGQGHHGVLLVLEREDLHRASLAPLGPFDLIMADPPYALVDTGAAPRALAGLVDAGLLAPGGRLVLEHASRSTPPAIAGVSLEDERRYGDTTVCFYLRPGPGDGG